MYKKSPIVVCNMLPSFVFGSVPNVFRCLKTVGDNILIKIFKVIFNNRCENANFNYYNYSGGCFV